MSSCAGLYNDIGVKASGKHKKNDHLTFLGMNKLAPCFCRLAGGALALGGAFG